VPCAPPAKPGWLDRTTCTTGECSGYLLGVGRRFGCSISEKEGKIRGANTWWVLTASGRYTAPSCVGRDGRHLRLGKKTLSSVEGGATAGGMGYGVPPIGGSHHLVHMC